MIRHLVAMFSGFGGIITRWAAVGAALSVIYWRIREAGRVAEQADRAQETIKAAAERRKIEDAIQTMPDADVRRELREWVRNDG